jgi:sec-independent protein translocase protein TatA
MPFRLGVPELLIIMGILILLFGAGRIGKIAGELGTGLNSFRKALTQDKEMEE